MSDRSISQLMEDLQPPKRDNFFTWSTGPQGKDILDPVEKRLQFANYIRQTDIDAGNVSTESEVEVQKGLYKSLVEGGYLEQGDTEGFTNLIQPPDVSFNTKLDLVQSQVSSDNPDWESVTEYKTALSLYSEDDERVTQIKQRSEEALDRMYEIAKLKMLRSKNLPFISTENEEGQRIIVAGDAALGMDLGEALKASKAGGVSLSDAYLAKDQLDAVDGTNVPTFKFNRYNEARSMVKELIGQSSRLELQVDAHAKNRVESEEGGFLDGAKGLVDDAATAISSIFSDETRWNADAIEELQKTRKESVIRSMQDKINNFSDLPEGEEYSYDEVEAAYDQTVLERGQEKGLFEFYEGEEAGKNLRMTAMGVPVIHPAAIVNENAFNDMVAANPEVPKGILEKVKTERARILTESFDDYAELLSRSAVSDAWNEANTQGVIAGKKKHEILNDFLIDEDNYNVFKEKAKGIGWSVLDGLGTLLAAVPAVVGSDIAREYLADSAQRTSDRREVAKLFNQDYGVRMDVGEAVAPLIADLAATGFLTLATTPAAGAGGALYVAARAGSVAGVKSLTKGLLANTIKTAPRIIGRGSPKTLAEVIETSLKTIDGKLTTDALKASNGAIARKLGMQSAIFVPAATRSGASTYGTITNHLRAETDLSKEEIHDKALGAGLVSGMVTGIITTGFSLLGRGGIDDALLRGMSFKEFKTVLSSLDDFAKEYSDKAVGQVISGAVKEVFKKGGKLSRSYSHVKNFSDEFMEEGLDQFVNSFVEDITLDKDTPLLERISSAAYAGMIGGILGVGAPAVQKVGSRYRLNAASKQQQARDIQTDVLKRAKIKLEESGSPIAAEVFAAQYAIAARVRKEAPAQEAPTQEDAPQGILAGKTIEQIAQLAKVADAAEPNSVLTEEQKAASDFMKGLLDQDFLSGFPDLSSFEDEVKGVDVKLLEGKSLQDIFKLAEIADATDSDGVITEEQKAALDVRNSLLSKLGQAPKPEETVEDDTTEEVQEEEEVEDTETQEELKEINDNLQATSQQALRRKVNSILYKNSPDKLESFPNAKTKEARKQAKTATGPINLETEKPSKVTEIETEEVRENVFLDEPTLATFKTGKDFSPEDNDAAQAVLDLAAAGFPLRFNSNRTYGVPFNTKKLADKSEFLAKLIFSKYPLITTKQATDKFTSLRAVTRFDPALGKTVKGKVKGQLDKNGNGVFNNDPVVMAEMLAHGLRIPVSDDINIFDINPSIKVQGGFVVDVLKPSDTGVGVESAVDPVSAIKNLETDFTQIQKLSRIPFQERTKDERGMPYGTRAINEIGITQDVSDTPLTYGEIRQQLDSFIKGAYNDPNIVKPLLTTTRGFESLDSTNFEKALLETHLEYRHLLHMFELRGEVMSQLKKHVDVVGGVVSVKNTKASRNAIKKALMARMQNDSLAEVAQAVQPFVKGAKKTHTETIVSFVESEALNNDSFGAGSMPTLDTVLKKKVKRYVSMEIVRGSQQRRNIEVTNTDLGVDQVENPLDDVYGEGDQGVGFDGSIGSIDSSESLSDEVFYKTLKDATVNLISSIDESPKLRSSIEDLYTRALHPEATQRQLSIISKMKTEDLIATLGTYLGTGSHTSKPEVLEFVKQLEEASIDSGADLKSALYLNFLTYRYEGNPVENPEIIQEVQRLMTDSIGRRVTRADATNFIKAMDTAVRRRFSRSHVSEDVRAVLESLNIADVERLGIQDGDAESVITALERIASTSDNKSHKLVAELLLEDKEFIRSVDFTLGSSVYPVAGEYNLLKDGSHNVYINIRTGNGLGLENVLLEEYVHAFLSDISNKPEADLKPNQKAARQRLKGLYELSKKEYQKSGYTSPVLEDAFENFDEFLAKFLLSPHLQAHIKSIKAPEGQRGFFSRIIDSLMSMFRKLTGREKTQYTEALADIVTLSKTTIRSTAVPATQAAMEAAESASNDVKETTDNLESEKRLPQDKPTVKQLEEQPDTDQQKLDQNIEQVVEEVKQSGKIANKDQRRMETLMFHLKSRMPLGLTVKRYEPDSTQKDDSQKRRSPAWVEGNVVYLNPPQLMAEVDGFDSVGARVYLETILNHELAHVASYNALTEAEINEFVDSLDTTEFVAIANTYYRNDADRGASVALLQTEINDDTAPETLREIANEKLRLTEEKLRMHLEKVTKGTTTEEDLDFWSSNPNIFRMLARYIRAAFSKMVAVREMRGGSSALDALLQKVHNESILLNVGFNRMASSVPFDTNDPAASILEFARISNDDPLAESEVEQEAVDSAVRLFASSISPDFPNRIMRKAKLRMTDASEFVVDDTESELEEVDTEGRQFDSQTNMDHGLLLDLAQSLSNDTREVTPSIFEEDETGIHYLEIEVTDKEGNQLATLQSELRSDGEVFIEYMANLSGNSGNSFSSDFLTTLIAYSNQIGAKKVTTDASGDNGNIHKKQMSNLYNQFLNVLTETAADEDVAVLRSMTLPQSRGMDGYYSWPSLGFSPDNESKVESALFDYRDRELMEKEVGAFRREIVSNQEEALNKLPVETKELILKKIDEIESNRVNLIVQSAEEVSEAGRTDEGGVDLFKALHEGNPSQNKNMAAAWKYSGSTLNMTFDLSDGSKNIQSYAKRTLRPILRGRKVEGLKDLVSEFREARNQPDADVEALREVYNNRAQKEVGLSFKLFAASGTSISTTSNLDYSNVIKLLEIPMTEFQAYKAPKGWLSRIFAGDVGAPVKTLVEQRDEFKKATLTVLKGFQDKFNEAAKRDKIDISNPAVRQTISEAQGYIDGDLVDRDVYDKIESDHQKRKAAIEADDTLTKAKKKADIKASRQVRDNEIGRAEDAAVKDVETKRDLAIKKLTAMSPDMAVLITTMRKQLIQPLQEKLKGTGLSKGLKARIDQTGGFYITRAYRMFNDPTFARKVREDKNYSGVRSKAMAYFDTSLKDHAFKAAKNAGKTDNEAQQIANKALRDANAQAGNGSYATEMLNAFISRYEGVVSGDGFVSGKYSKALKNLTKRRDLEKPLRDLLGEYGSEVGTDLLMRTFMTVSNLTAEQVMRQNVAEVGLDQGFLVDAATYQANPEKYVPIKPSANRNDPLANLFVERENADDIRAAITPATPMGENSTSAKTVSAVGAIAQNLTGKAMLFKTLGSVGFYLRNILGNALFFGPAQGFVDTKRVLSDSFLFSATQFKDPNKIDAYLTELVGLGVMGDELRAGMIRELLNAETSPESRLEQLNDLLDKTPVIGGAKKASRKLEEKLAGLSASIDGSFKIAYFEFELSQLREAQAAEGRNGVPLTDLSNANDYDLKRMAARKVKMTAQSLSQAPPIISQLSKSSYGMLFAAFIRFKAEVPRIVVNTYTLAKEERASKNPIIAARGRKRFWAMSSMLGVGSMAFAQGLAMLAGIGEEEDEALTKGMPRFLRGHSFWYFGKGKDLKSLDLTYLNPFSLLTDPTLRALRSIVNLEFGDAASEFLQGLIFDQYLDEQILAGSIADVLDNRNATTGRSIWIPEVDGFGSTLTKMMGYVFENAYEPRVINDVFDAFAAMGGDYNKFTDSPLGEFLDGVWPVKVHSVDSEQQFRRFLRDHQSRMKDVTDAKFKLYRDKPIDDDDVREVYQDERDGRRALNSELYRVIQGYEGLGLNIATQNDLMKQYGIGKDKIKLIPYGLMDRPDLNKRFVDGLTERGHIRRAALLYEERNKEPRYMSLRD